MTNAQLAEILTLPIAERMRLVQVIWESIRKSPDPYPLSESEERELERRLAAYREHPEKTSTWPEVKARILGEP